MQATSEQIIGLTKLQHLDQSIARLRQRLDSLPQKQAIADARAKRAAIRQKQRALAGARKDAEGRLAELRDEDARLEQAAVAAQRAIEASSHDYRAVAARSAELEQIASRRDELHGEASSIEGRLADIAGVEPQASAMSARLEEHEARLIADYRREGGGLLAEIARLEDERASLAGVVGQQIMAHYDRLAKAKQGVALAHLVDGACNTCRSRIDASRILVLRSEYPLSFCPHCGRLMVVDRRYAG